MDRKGLAILVLAAVILFLLFSPPKSKYIAAPISGANLGAAGAVVDRSAGVMSAGPSGGAVSSASLIPREVVQTEDFGQFSPDKILSGQNYLDPRSQIGYPETLGGVLRNANQ
jgi:hypothetical protein